MARIHITLQKNGVGTCCKRSIACFFKPMTLNAYQVRSNERAQLTPRRPRAFKGSTPETLAHVGARWHAWLGSAILKTEALHLRREIPDEVALELMLLGLTCDNRNLRKTRSNTRQLVLSLWRVLVGRLPTKL